MQCLEQEWMHVLSEASAGPPVRKELTTRPQWDQIDKQLKPFIGQGAVSEALRGVSPAAIGTSNSRAGRFRGSVTDWMGRIKTA